MLEKIGIQRDNIEKVCKSIASSIICILISINFYCQPFVLMQLYFSI